MTNKSSGGFSEPKGNKNKTLPTPGPHYPYNIVIFLNLNTRIVIIS